MRPTTDLDPRYSDEGATPIGWAEAGARLRDAEIYWLSTVRPDGRPHVTPLIAVWLDDALHFCTGPDERKARNLEDNPQVVLTTGCSALHEGLDLVVEGTAVPVRDTATLQRLAGTYESKYGPTWHFDVVGDAFAGGGGQAVRAIVFRVVASTVFGFGKGAYSQTRWRFSPAAGS